MRLWKNFSVAVRRRETPFYNFIYCTGMRFQNFSMPVIRPLHELFYLEWAARTSSWHNFWRVVYYEPMFKSQCAEVGPGFRMLYAGNGITRILGDLEIHIGAHATIFDNTYFVGLKVLEKPKLFIGDYSYIGPQVHLMVGREIKIGRQCLITSKIITDNPGHSTRDVMERIQTGGGSPSPEDIRPVRIGDYCFLALDTVVYPGVTVGDGVVARIGTHINKDVPPFCLVAGNPAVIVRKLDIPEALSDIVGQERYKSWLDTHRSLSI